MDASVSFVRRIIARARTSILFGGALPPRFLDIRDTGKDIRDKSSRIRRRFDDRRERG
jgi:hypothetical protein